MLKRGRVYLKRSSLFQYTSTNISQHESTRVNTSLTPVNTSPTPANTNQHESGTSQHESTRIKQVLDKILLKI